jgi:hypothetical protein
MAEETTYPDGGGGGRELKSKFVPVVFGAVGDGADPEGFGAGGGSDGGAVIGI